MTTIMDSAKTEIKLTAPALEDIYIRVDEKDATAWNGRIVVQHDCGEVVYVWSTKQKSLVEKTQ